MKTLKKNLGYALCILLVAVIGANYLIDKKEKEEQRELVELAYQYGWWSGANATVDETNKNGYFDRYVAVPLYKKDSLAFVGLLYGN